MADDFTCPTCGPYTPVINRSHRCADPTDIAERVLQEHVVRGYFCSCGQEVNDSVRHVAANIARAFATSNGN